MYSFHYHILFFVIILNALSATSFSFLITAYTLSATQRLNNSFCSMWKIRESNMTCSLFVRLFPLSIRLYIGSLYQELSIAVFAAVRFFLLRILFFEQITFLLFNLSLLDKFTTFIWFTGYRQPSFYWKFNPPTLEVRLSARTASTFRAAQIFLSGWKNILLCSDGHTFGSNPKGFELLKTYLAMLEWTYTELAISLWLVI